MVHESLPRELESNWLKGNIKYVLGVDEAGRGPLAGPVVAASCIVEKGISIDGIQDSKATTEKQREEIYEKLTSHPGVYWSASVIDNRKIDEINILQATMLGMRISAEDVFKKHPKLQHNEVKGLIDGNRVPENMPCHSEFVIKGDAKVYSIAAASIIAKVTRDRIMMQLDKEYPQYNFAKHKGYPVGAHRAILQEIGPSPSHRFSYTPVKKAAAKFNYDYTQITPMALFGDDATDAHIDHVKASVVTSPKSKKQIAKSVKAVKKSRSLKKALPTGTTLKTWNLRSLCSLQ
jgi:ribonuclease HII